MELARKRTLAALTMQAMVLAVLIPAPAQAKPAATSRPSKTLQQATERYQSQDYFTASELFGRVTRGESDDSAANRQRAEFYLGRTLYHLKYHAASMAYFSRIVERGPAHRYHGATLEWLVALSRVLPDSSGILEKIGHYAPSELDDSTLRDARDELHYLLGLHFYQRGRFEKALEALARVQRKSPLFVNAKFLEGTTHTRTYQGRKALAAFKELLVIARTRPGHFAAADIDRFEELATLQIARLFYTTRQPELALKYYGRISRQSPDYPAAVREAAWAQLMSGQHSRAVATIHTLNAPALKKTFSAESAVLEAYIYFQRCLYRSSLRTLAGLQAKYGALRDGLKKVLEKYEDNAEFYQYVSRLERTGARSEADRLILQMLGNSPLKATIDWLHALDRELELFRAAPNDWQRTQVASEVLQELTLQRALAEADAGKRSRDRLRRQEQELRFQFRDAMRLRLESPLEIAIERKVVKVTDAPVTEPSAPPERDEGSKQEGTDEEDEFELEPPEPEEIEVVKTKPLLASDPRLEERAWEFVSSPGTGRDGPFAIAAGHPLWKLDGGFAQIGQGGYRLRFMCAKGAENEPPTVGRATDDSDHFDFENDALARELVRPDAVYPTSESFRNSPMIPMRRQFILEILLSAEEVFASRVR